MADRAVEDFAAQAGLSNNEAKRAMGRKHRRGSRATPPVDESATAKPQTDE